MNSPSVVTFLVISRETVCALREIIQAIKLVCADHERIDLYSTGPDLDSLVVPSPVLFGMELGINGGSA